MASKAIKLDEYEEGMILQALMDLRNKQINSGKSGDCISELILKIERASIKGLFPYAQR